MPICELSEFIKYLLRFHSVSGTKLESVEGCTFTPTFLDVFIATVVICFPSDEREKSESDCQKLHHDNFASFPLKAFVRAICKVRMPTQVWFYTEHCLSVSLINNDSQMSETVSDPRTGMFMPALKQRLVTDFFNGIFTTLLRSLVQCMTAI